MAFSFQEKSVRAPKLGLYIKLSKEVKIKELILKQENLDIITGLTTIKRDMVLTSKPTKLVVFSNEIDSSSLSS